MLEDLGLDDEGLLGVEAQRNLGSRHLVGAERGAVHAAGVLLGRGGPADDRGQRDDRRLRGLRLGREDRVVQRVRVLVVALGRHPVHALRVPAVSGVAAEHVLVEGDVGLVLDRDLVVVPDHDEVAELLDARDGGRLGGDALLQVAVGDHDVDEVVEGRGAGRGVGVEQAALTARGHRHADGGRDAGTEWAGRDLDAGGVAELGVTRRLRALGAQRLDVVERQRVAGREQLQVQRERRVTARKHEAVAAKPLGVRGVMLHDVLEEQVRRRRERHRGAGVAVADLLHGIGGEHTEGVDGAAVSIGPGEGHRRLPMAGFGCTSHSLVARRRPRAELVLARAGFVPC